MANNPLSYQNTDLCYSNLKCRYMLNVIWPKLQWLYSFLGPDTQWGHRTRTSWETEHGGYWDALQTKGSSWGKVLSKGAVEPGWVQSGEHYPLRLVTVHRQCSYLHCWCQRGPFLIKQEPNWSLSHAFKIKFHKLSSLATTGTAQTCRNLKWLLFWTPWRQPHGSFFHVECFTALTVQASTLILDSGAELMH